ncbi:hypothetical protein QVD17_36514 [Tagetes erecta]|uniref:Uncharacterized protein n=1 Tax=Tagetes erecta TaxID=13708 RepID=A0AAD8NJA2_TARER|nr:hypothetical protein QVD17_36514 [Tagetes erecta]
MCLVLSLIFSIFMVWFSFLKKKEKGNVWVVELGKYKFQIWWWVMIVKVLYMQPYSVCYIYNFFSLSL